jgi:hypothetical protein
MPTLNANSRIDRLQQRIAELKAGNEIDAKHINAVLGDEGVAAFDRLWAEQQALRKVKRPAALAAYETLHKQASALLARCDSSDAETKAALTSISKLQIKCHEAIHKAHAAIVTIITNNNGLQQWLDRDVVLKLPSMLTISALSGIDVATVQHNGRQLDQLYDQLPILVCSKNERKRISMEERFGWKTKRDIRIELMQQALTKLNHNIIAEIEKEQYQREVKAAKVFMDAYFKADDEGKNADSEANLALQRSGFPRTDLRSSKGIAKRGREIQQMEEDLISKFESAMTSDQREQLAMSREFDQQTIGTRKKVKKSDGINSKLAKKKWIKSKG